MGERYNMTIESSLVLEIWEILNEYLPNSKKEEAAVKLLLVFENYSLERRDFETIRGEDNYIDAAIDSIYDEEESDDHDEEDEY